MEFEGKPGRQTKEIREQISLLGLGRIGTQETRCMATGWIRKEKEKNTFSLPLLENTGFGCDGRYKSYYFYIILVVESNTYFSHRSIIPRVGISVVLINVYFL